MLKPFKTKRRMLRSASQIRVGDLVDDVFAGEVVYVHETTHNNSTYLTIVLKMRKRICGSKTASFTTSPDRKIKVLKK